MNRFGISLTFPEQLAVLPETLPPELTVLEFPGCVLEDGVLRRQLAARRDKGLTLLCRELVDRSVAGIIGRESVRVQLSFSHQLLRRCEKLAALEVAAAESGFDLFAALEDAGTAQAMHGVLGELASAFLEYRIGMLLAFRIPVPVGGGLAPAEAAQAAQAFRRGLLLPDLGFAVDLCLHEPGAPESAAAILPLLNFHDNVWRMVFDPELGNRLEAAQVKKLLDSHPSPLLSGRTVLFAPRHALPDEELLRQLAAAAAGGMGKSR